MLQIWMTPPCAVEAGLPHAYDLAFRSPKIFCYPSEVRNIINRILYFLKLSAIISRSLFTTVRLNTVINEYFVLVHKKLYKFFLPIFYHMKTPSLAKHNF